MPYFLLKNLMLALKFKLAKRSSDPPRKLHGKRNAPEPEFRGQGKNVLTNQPRFRHGRGEQGNMNRFFIRIGRPDEAHGLECIWRMV